MKFKYGIDKSSLFVPMLDAAVWRFTIRYWPLTGSTVREISAEIIDENSFRDIPENVRILIFGDGATKCRQVVNKE